MPAGRTHFNNDWLECKDKQGFIIKNWCERNIDEKHKVFCKLCKKVVRCDNQGLPQLLQHAEGSGHKKLAKDVLGGSQMSIAITVRPDHHHGMHSENADSAPSPVVSKVGQATVSCFSSKDQATKAELIWAMKTVQSKFSYASCDGISDIFRAMFPEGFPQGFRLSSSKVSYLISEAVGPYFHQQFISDLLRSGSLYTLQYDETTNKQAMKQLDLRVRFWSSTADEVRVQHLRTYLMGTATAKKLSEKILSAIEESCIPLDKLLMLGSDGPNVNKAVWSIINKSCLELEKRSKGLLDIGTCNLHVVFNAFKKGLDTYGKTVSELNIDLYQWFKLSPARKEDYGNIQESRGVKRQGFIKHVECKWITFLPAIERILQEWDNLKFYFLSYLPKEQASVVNNARYIRITNCLKNKETLVQMHFLKSVNLVFHRFLTFFQKEEPLIHVLYNELASLLKKLLSRFIKQEALADKGPIELTKINIELLENHLPYSLIDIGEDTRKSLKDIIETQRKLVLMKMKAFLVVCTKYLQKTLPLSKGVLSDFRSLAPTNRNEDWTLRGIQSIATALPLELNVDDLCDEWRAYQLEAVPEELYMVKESLVEKPVYKRLDHYWREILRIRLLTGELKYPELARVVKACLVVSHGNSDVERGFSVIGGSVTSERVKLSEESVNSIQCTTDGLKFFGNMPQVVPITKEFLALGRKAHCSYVRRLEESKNLLKKKRLEEEQKRAEEVQRKAIQESVSKKNNELKTSEKDIAAKESSQYMEMDVGSSILREANEKLKVALKEKDLKKIAIAQALLETAHMRIESAKSGLEQTRVEQQKVQKRKQTLIESFLSKAKKSK